MIAPKSIVNVTAKYIKFANIEGRGIDRMWRFRPIERIFQWIRSWPYDCRPVPRLPLAETNSATKSEPDDVAYYGVSRSPGSVLTTT